MSSYTVMINTGLVVLPIAMAVLTGLPILILGYLLADVPCTQVMRTFMSYGQGAIGERDTRKKGSFLNKINSIFEGQSAQTKLKEEELAANVNVWCLRLNKSMTYDDIVASTSVLRNTLLPIALALIIIGVVINPIFIVLGVFTLGYAVMAKDFVINGLKSNIKKLNKSILFELDTLCHTVAELLPVGGKSVEEIFKEYRPQSMVLGRDIDIFLSDVRNMSISAALTQMTMRIQTGDTMDEFTQFVDQLKSDANPISTSENLRQIARRIHESYITEFIKQQYSTKEALLAFCGVMGVAMVPLVYVIPNFVTLLSDMNSVFA